MSSGYFILSVRTASSVSFAVLETGATSQRLKYDEASRERAGRRDAVLELTKASKDRWSQNYKPYSDASFRIEEVDADGVVRLISGPAYDADNTKVRNDLRQRLVLLAGTYPNSRYQTKVVDRAELLADFLFVGSESWAEWSTVTLHDRIELCRAVAAGILTPAINA